MNDDKYIPSNVIKFPEKPDDPSDIDDIFEVFDEWGDDLLGFDEWQIDYDLIEKEDYEALLKIRRERLEKDPDNEYSQYYLGEAYMYAKQYIKGLHFLSQIHRKDPERIEIQYLILDILFAINKTENDFDWLEKPEILPLTDELIETCYGYVKDKNKSCSIDEVYSHFIFDGYMPFSRKDLLEKMMKDDRFVVENPDDDFFAFIGLRAFSSDRH